MNTHPHTMVPVLLAAASMLVPGLLHAQTAPAQGAPADPPISDQEFHSSIVNKSVTFRGADGKDYRLRLEDGGRAVVSLGFNDVGRWWSTGPGAYCLIWNKLPMNERCAYILRRDGKLAFMTNAGLTWIERVE